ncbi:MAG: MBOAT family O-acyltransferase [Planctomycetota bacterium]
MIFSQFIFVLFISVVFSFLVLVRHNRARKLFLLAASYYFYAYWDWRFCGLLLLSTIVDFWIGHALKRTDNERSRTCLLLISLAVNLGMLGFFKYYGFFVESMQTMLSPLGWNLSSLGIILPVGISFYTFQTLSYTIDVYRRKLDVCEDIFDFALFVSFFPQLVAGPIVRASEFLPQLNEYRPLTGTRFFLGFRQFTFGLVKKVLIADHLAMVVDFSFENAGAMDGISTWVGAICYTGQIYCDFSGYSDMAIGIARGMGYDFCPNFNHPFAGNSLTTHWRRWHISLSTWLRDYLYIPLGGNRKGKIRTYINLLLTMLLGGLWHGAAWRFVAWGAIHGSALALEKRFDIHTRIDQGSTLNKFFGWAYMMLVVVIAFVFFRAESFGQAIIIIKHMFDPTTFFTGTHWVPLRAVLCLMFIAATHAISMTRFRHVVELKPDRWYTPVLLFTMIYLVLIFQPTSFKPFIYFQF